jgi:hypothetical protein
VRTRRRRGLRVPSASYRGPVPVAVLKRTLRVAELRYLSFPNVVGIGIGTKFVRRKATDNHACIHFFVSVKAKEARLGGNRLPRYLIGRAPDGSLMRRIRIPTDVIRVGRVTAICGSGSPLVGLGQGGVATIMFRDKRPQAVDCFLLTCAHVVGNVRAPVMGAMASGCDPATIPFARTVATSSVKAGSLKYDVALAKMDRQLTPAEDMSIDGTPIRLTSFLPRNAIRPPARYSCRFPVSNTQSGLVTSFFGKVQVTYSGVPCIVENAFVLQASVLPGDSGGLIFAGDSAVGIAFARSPEGLTWFHGIGDALKHAIGLYGEPLQCF